MKWKWCNLYFFGVGPHSPIDWETSKKSFFLSLLVISVYTISMGDKYNTFFYLYRPLGPFHITLYFFFVWAQRPPHRRKCRGVIFLWGFQYTGVTMVVYSICRVVVVLVSDIDLLYGVLEFWGSGLRAAWCYVSIFSARYSSCSAAREARCKYRVYK